MANFMQPIMMASAGFLLTIMVSLLLAAFDTATVRVRSTEHWYACVQRQLLINSFISVAQKIMQTIIVHEQVIPIIAPVWVPATAVIHFDTSPVTLEIQFNEMTEKVIVLIP